MRLSPSRTIAFCLAAVFACVGLLHFAVPALAQEDSCSPVLNALISGIQADTCSVVAEGSACYASEDLLAVLRQKGQSFASPNDRVDIANLRRLETQAPQGAAILIADTPEQPVKLLIFGDVSVGAQGGNVFTMYEQEGQPICEKTPSGMLVQTPQGETGQVIVNGVTIRLGSTAFVSMDGVLLFDQDPRSGRRSGDRNPDAPLCSGFDSECDFGSCRAGDRLVWGPFCREDRYSYIEPGLYRVSLYGGGQVQAGATDYNATQEDFAYGSQKLTLPASYTFCYPGLQPGGTGFETLVKSVSSNARIDRITLQFLGADCTSRTFRLSSKDQQSLDALMRRWDDIRIESLNTLDEELLTSILSGAALEDQLDTLDQLRDSKCYWIIDELEPAETIYTEAIGSDQARVFALKNWDMDMVCNGRRLEMPDYDGNFIGAYTVQRTGGTWRITEKDGYDIEAGERPTIAAGGELQLMTISNVEGSVEVTALGVTRPIPPGRQVRVVLYENQPVSIGEPVEDLLVAESPVIDWLSNDDDGLPLVNRNGDSGGDSALLVADTTGPWVSEVLNFYTFFYPEWEAPDSVCRNDDFFKFGIRFGDPSGVQTLTVNYRIMTASGEPIADWVQDVYTEDQLVDGWTQGIIPIRHERVAEFGTVYVYMTATDGSGNTTTTPTYEFPVVDCN